MKTSFDISSRFPLPADLAKEYARFCLKLALAKARRLGRREPHQVSFRLRSSATNFRSGRARVNLLRALPGVDKCRRFDPAVFVKLGKYHALGGLLRERYSRYAHRADCPETIVDGPVEAYVRLVGHELGHGVCGFGGDMTGEYHCERLGAECLEAWRLAYRDNACMI